MRDHIAKAHRICSDAQHAGPVFSHQSCRRLHDRPGPLGKVLAEFGAQSGVLLSFDPQQLQGRQSPGLQGDYSVQDGFATLLAGTGLQEVADSQGRYQLHDANQGVMTLDLIKVEGVRTGGPVYEPVEGSVATRSAVATKTNTSLLETPQSISVVPRDQLAVRNVQTDAQALLYVPGVWAQPFGGDQNQNNPFFCIRGFPSSFGGSYVDGLVSPVNYRYEPFGVERFDVLRGPTSTLYGQSDPGGMINRTSKRPTENFQAEIQAQVGTFDRRQLAVDVGGPFDEQKQVLYRLTGLVRDADAPFSYEFGADEPDERQFIAPALTWQPNDKTSVTLLSSFLKDEIDAASTFTNPAGELTRINLEQPGFGVYDYEQSLLGYAFQYQFSEAIQLRQNLRWSSMDLDTLGIFQGAFDETNRTVARETFGFSEERNDLVVDTHLESSFVSGSVAHTLLVGIDHQHLDDEIVFSFGPAPDLNIDNPNYALAIPAATPFSQSDINSRNMGIYLQEQAKINHRWVLTLGARYDDSRVTVKDRLAGGKTRREDDELSYRAGLSHVGKNGLAPYVSFATSFFPAGGVDRLGSAFEPTTGKQIETGLKYRPTGFNGFFYASLYQLTRQNVLTPDPVDPNFRVQSGEVRSKGVELEGSMDLNNGLSATVSYTYNDTEVTKDNPVIVSGAVAVPSNEGKSAILAPEHLASAWLNYKVQNGASQGLLLGAGVRYVGASFADAQNTIENRSYTLFDAVISYDLGQIDAALRGTTLAINASNLFDKEYTTCFTRFDCQWGSERTILATLTYQW